MKNKNNHSATFYNFARKCHQIIKSIPKIISTRQLRQIKCNYKWFGSDYGGFYICTDVIGDNQVIVYSAGVGEDISFDMDMINEYPNCNVFAFDPTPKSIEWIGKQNLPENYKFFPCGLSDKTGETRMFLPKNKEHISGSIHESNHLSKENSIVVQMKCIEDILKENNHEYVDIIKMDIEGAEFSVLENLSFEKLNCGQIAIEFHERFFNNGKNLIDKAIKKLNENGYFCFAISNNGEEYSFINTKIYKK